MASPKFGYWALVASAAAIALIGVVTLVWGVTLYARMASGYADRLAMAGVVLIVAGYYSTRRLLERGQ